MRKWRSGRFIVLFFAVFFVSELSAHAELFNRGTDTLGYQLIYDSDLDITWYDYTKSASTWQNQVNWASGLAVDFGGTIYDDWRLPTTVDGPYVYGTNGSTTGGYNITSSEMGHLYYAELGNKGYCSTSGICPQSGYGLKNKGPFTNLLSYYYWSGTQYAASTGSAWNFNAYNGTQGYNTKNSNYDALAVRPGDVAAAVAPEPISSIFFVTGGSLLAGIRYLRRKK